MSDAQPDDSGVLPSRFSGMGQASGLVRRALGSGSLHTGVGLAGCRKGAPLLHGATTLYADDEGVDAGPRPPSCANQQGTSAPGGLVPGHASLRGSLNACGPGRALRAKPGPCPWRIRPSLLQVTRARSTREETSPARYSVLFR